MAEKRKLLAEIEKCYKKIDEGVELFEEIMNKMHEANSDNQRDKYQDDLKKEIKKLQRLRDQVKGWQNCSDIKLLQDKEKLNQYRKLIEQRMEQFKDIERENKTKPHSKQGLCAEEKLDPKEKEKYDVVDWIQTQMRELNDEADRTEMQIESMATAEVVKKRGKKDEKKGEKEKRTEELKRHLERMKFHIGKLEVCMRMVNNESLEAKKVISVLKEPLEAYIELLPSDNDNMTEVDMYDPEDAYEDLNLEVLCVQLGGVTMSANDDEHKENCHENGTLMLDGIAGPGIGLGDEKLGSSRHNSSESPVSPAGRRTVIAAVNVPPSPSFSDTAKAKLTKESSFDAPPLSPAALISPVASTAVPPPPQGIPYNSVAAGRSTIAASAPSPKPMKPPTPIAMSPVLNTSASSTATLTNTPVSATTVNTTTPATSTTPSVVEKSASNDTMTSTSTQRADSASSLVDAPLSMQPTTMVMTAAAASATSAATAMADSIEKSNVNGEASKGSRLGTPVGMQNNDDAALRSLRLSQNKQTPSSTEPKRAHIPAWLGASPLGRATVTQEYETQLTALELALTRTQLPLDSERPRTYLPKIACPSPPYYAQTVPANSDSLEYYLRLSPDTLFFIFYYMEGTRAQLLAAKALKKLSWRFHTKYLTWFQRHEEPKQITDDYEQGTYVYFDFEKWSQRKKESFTFEYKYLEDKDFD